jgi:hypothetical protein
MLTMQDAVLMLTRYWAEHGCMIVQPMNTEVGAGTLNPATALRVLGPEPWRVAYAEPSVMQIVSNMLYRREPTLKEGAAELNAFYLRRAATRAGSQSRRWEYPPTFRRIGAY